MLIFTFKTLFPNLLPYSQEHTQIRVEQCCRCQRLESNEDDADEDDDDVEIRRRIQAVNTAHIILKFYYKR
jgi:hypothetical protein